MIETDQSKCLTLLREINFVDSELIGLEVDIYKLRLLIDVRLSSHLKAFGLNPVGENLCFDFRLLGGNGYCIEMKRLVPHGPTHTCDGELLLNTLGRIDLADLEVVNRGMTTLTDRDGVEGAPRPIFEICLPYCHGKVTFQFTEMRVCTFREEDLDPFFVASS